MAYGLQIFNSSGQNIIDTSSRLGKLLGSTIVNQSGSLTDSSFLVGVPFYIVVPYNTTGNYEIFNPVEVSFSGSTMTYNILDSDSYTIYYGVY